MSDHSDWVRWEDDDMGDVFLEPNRKPEPVRFRDYENKEYMDLFDARLSDDRKAVWVRGLAPNLKEGEPLRAQDTRVSIVGIKLEDGANSLSLAQTLDLSGGVRFYRTATGGTGFISAEETDRLIEAGFVRFVVE